MADSGKAYDSQTAIRLTDVGKKYRVYFEKPALVRSLLPFLSQGSVHHEFWALRDINLEIKRGECIGIIGPNGAGKSTILSVLAGISEPTLGDVEINGRISALLSLGAGFQPELTGRENIYLNAAILGMRRAEVDAIFDQIVEYAGIGEFMEAKLSTYSSGMNMRLGFAIAVNVPFDILLIDELLAVGDMKFQQKCFKTLMEFTEDENRTIIFVSHDISRVEEICSRVLWLEHGRIQEADIAEDVVRKYRERYREQFIPRALKKKSQRQMEVIRPAYSVVDAGRALRSIPPLLFGANVDWDSEGRNVWDLKKKRLIPTLTKKIGDFRFGLLRFPGGHHADFYHWQGAVGDIRTEQVNGATQEKIYPYFGPDEFITLCKEVRAEPLLTADAANGTADEIVEWLAHSRDRGLRVRYVEIGHEPYNNESHVLGKVIHMAPEQYATTVCKFASAIRKFDPAVKILACGCLDTGGFPRYRYPDWNRIVLEAAGNHIDYLSVHNTNAPIWNITPEYKTPSFDMSFEALMAAPLYVQDNIEKVRAQIQGLGKKCRIAVTDYCADFLDVPRIIFGKNEVRKREPYAINQSRNSTIGTALYEAMVLNVFMRSPDIEVACRNFIHNPIYPALLRVDHAGITRNAQYYMHRLYNRMAGKMLVWSDISVGTYQNEAVGVIPAQAQVPYLDQVALLDEDGSTLSIVLVNRSIAHHVKTKIVIRGFEFKSALQVYINSPEFDSRNEHPGDNKIWFSQNSVDAREITHAGTGRVTMVVPPHAIAALILRRDKWL